MCTKGRFQFLPIKTHEKAPNCFKDVFLKKLSFIEENLEKIIKKKEHDEKYERLLNQLVKENLFLEDKIRRKDRVINILLASFSDILTRTVKLYNIEKHQS